MKVTKREYDRLMRMRSRIFDYENFIDDLKNKYAEKRRDDSYELSQFFEEIDTHLWDIQDLLMQMDDWEE